MKFNDNTDIDVVWVDLDDTIIDFTTNSRKALQRLYDTGKLCRWFADSRLWAESYERYNKELWAKYNVGDVSREVLRMERFAQPLVEAGVARAEAEIMSRCFDPLYLDYLAQERALMPGALVLLGHLRKSGVKTGVLSNGFKEVQYRKIRAAGIERYIDIVVLSDDAGVNKPDKRVFEYAMRRSGRDDPSRHLLIGDNPDTDIAGALDAGWQAVHYLPARAVRAGVKPAKGCVIADDLAGIVSLFET